MRRISGDVGGIDVHHVGLVWSVLVNVATTGQVVPEMKAGMLEAPLEIETTVIDTRPLPVSWTVTSSCSGGPTRTAVIAQVGGVLSGATVVVVGGMVVFVDVDVDVLVVVVVTVGAGPTATPRGKLPTRPRTEICALSRCGLADEVVVSHVVKPPISQSGPVLSQMG